MSASELEALFDLAYHFRHVEEIFARVFASEAAALDADSKGAAPQSGSISAHSPIL
jgi:hypothetical protein